MKKEKIERIFSCLQAHNPHPATELKYTSVFELLIAVLLSAQATDISVNKATDKLYKIANTPQAILALGVDGLIPYVQTIGLFRSKAKNVIATCQILIEQHQGKVPRHREALEALPGVGRKTANVILNTAFGEPTIAVDTHIFRISNRIGLTQGNNVEEVEQQLLKVVPDTYKQDAHHWLILHGRYICTARKTLCGQCCIADDCEFDSKTF